MMTARFSLHRHRRYPDRFRSCLHRQADANDQVWSKLTDGLLSTVFIKVAERPLLSIPSNGTFCCAWPRMPYARSLRTRTPDAAAGCLHRHREDHQYHQRPYYYRPLIWSAVLSMLTLLPRRRRDDCCLFQQRCEVSGYRYRRRCGSDHQQCDRRPIAKPDIKAF